MKKIPKTICLMAQTLDGKIGKDAKHFPDWTGKADKRFFVEVTKKSGVIIMGKNTFDTIGKPLPERHHIIMTRTPQKSPWENLEFLADTPEKILTDLGEQGFTEVIIAGGTQINGLFLQAQKIDELWITLSPTIFGKGLGLFPENRTAELQLLSVEKLDDQVILARYKVCY
jgi:dihydrofolate reductase